MLRRILLLSAIAVITGCSSSGSDDPADPAQPPAAPPGQPGTPTGTTEGTWAGNNEFGPSVFIIDSAQTLYGFSSNGAGQYQSVFGNITGPIERFFHRDSDDSSLGDAYTVVGDVGDPATISYSFSVSDDGRSLTNSSDAGTFTLSLADSNQVPAITIAASAGTWESRTAFCDPCNILVVSMTIAADGGVTGFTKFGLPADIDTVAETPLNGNVNEAGTFLGIQFQWAGQTRTGVLYNEAGTGKLVLNSYGEESAEVGNKSFSAVFTRQ